MQIVEAINRGLNLAVIQDMAPFATALYRDRIFAVLECTKLKARVDSYIQVHNNKSGTNCCSTPALCCYPNIFRPALIESKYCSIAKPELKVEIPVVKVETLETDQTQADTTLMPPPPPLPPKLKRQRKQFAAEPIVEIVDLCNDTECMST